MERHRILLKGSVALGMLCLGASICFAFGIVTTATDTQTTTETSAVIETSTSVDTSTASQTAQRTVGFGALSFHKPQFGQVMSGSTAEMPTTAPVEQAATPVTQSPETAGNRFTSMKFQTLSFGKQSSSAQAGSSDSST